MKKNILLTGGFTFLLILFDQWSKFWAIQFKDDPYVIITNFFKFTYQLNKGIAFSLPLPRILIIIVTSLFLGIGMFLAIKYFDWRENRTVIVVSLILSGAIGNLIDRIFHSAIVDFISISRYPVFNLADSFLTCGVVLFLIFYYKKL